MSLTPRIRAAAWAVLAVGASALAPFFGQPFEGAQTALAFTPRTFDFGTVQAGSLAHAEFAFVNESKSPVRILGVHGTCGCVQAEASQSYVEPGARGTVKATVMTEGRQGMVKFHVRVRTDEGAKGGASLGLKGQIRVALRPRPPRIFLGAVAPGSDHRKQIRVEKLEPVREVALACKGEGISARTSFEDAESLTLDITIKVPWAKPQRGSGIRLSCGEGSTWLPVVWSIPTPFELSAREVEIKGGKAELTAKPRWPGVTLARVDTRGLPLTVTRDGDRILFALTGSLFDIPSGASIQLVPEPGALGNVKLPVYVRPD